MPYREFPNLIPKDICFRFRYSTLIQENGKWIEFRPDSKITKRSASGLYIFAVIGGEIRICHVIWRYMGQNNYGHKDLTQGKPVLYAGQIQFSRRAKRGTMLWWNNDSGHYRPSPDYAAQAGLPMELFREEEFSYAPQQGNLVP